jgi:amino acid permease
MSFFAFSNQIEAINIQNEMRKFSEKRAHKMVLYSIIINFFFYLGVAYAGYFSTFE